MQLREKDMAPPDLAERARRLQGVVEGRAALFVNGSLDAATLSGAAGVHLPEQYPDAESVTRAAHEHGMLVSYSVHDAAGARRATQAGADLLQVGHIFATWSHPGAPPKGVELLRAVREVTPSPLIAVGGVTAERVEACVAAGASGIAVISAIGAAADPRLAARDLRDALDEAYRRRQGLHDTEGGRE